jgi:hypothetical protein
MHVNFKRKRVIFSRKRVIFTRKRVIFTHKRVILIRLLPVDSTRNLLLCMH